MAGIVLSKVVREMLIRHLVNIEEEKAQLLEKYYQDVTEERAAFEEFINHYIREIEGYIANAKVVNSKNKTCPFVVIGSIVEIEDLNYNEVEKYQIVSPFEDNVNPNVDVASYLSPMGKAMLLQKEKSKVMVKTPMGQFAYRILSIEIPEEMFSVVAGHE